MYLIVKKKGDYQAIAIKAGDKWDFYKLFVGRWEIRIILRLRGRRYLLYSTRAMKDKYPALGRAQMMLLCDEIIATTSERIASGTEHIDFLRITRASECRHHLRWRDMGLIDPGSLDQYYGHPVDPKTERLVSNVRLDQQEIITMNHEPGGDSEQDELPY